MERQYLIHYNTSGATSVPALDDLKYGEISVRYAAGNEALFIKNTDDELVTVELNKPIDLSGFYSKDEINEIMIASGNAINENKEKINTLSSYTEALTSEINTLKEDLDTIDVTISTALTELHEQVEDIVLNKADAIHTHEIEFTDLQNNIDAKQDKIENIEDFALKSDVSTAIANLVNSAPDTLDTLAEIANAIQTNSGVIETLNNAITNKADKTEIPSLSGFATEQWVEDKKFLTHQDISNLATKEELNAKADSSVLSGYSLTSHTHGEFATLQNNIDAKQDVITDLATIRSGAEKGATAVQPNDLNDYALKSELPTDYAKSSDLENKQNKTITIENEVNDTTKKVMEFTKILQGSELGDSRYTLDNTTINVIGLTGEIWFLVDYNTFALSVVTDEGTSGPLKWTIYYNENLQTSYDLSQYKYEGEASNNYYYCNGKYYKWNEQRILEETTKPTTVVSKTITIEQAIQEIYIKLGLL